MLVVLHYSNGYIYRFHKVNSFHTFNSVKKIVIQFDDGSVTFQDIDFIKSIETFF